MDARQQEQAYTAAHKLIRTAEVKGSLTDLSEEIREVLTVFDQQHLAGFFRNASIEADAKIGVLRLFQKEVSPDLSRFFEETIAHGDWDLLYPTLTEVVHHSQAALGQYDLSVTTAVPLTASQKLKLTAKAEVLLGVKVRQVVEKIQPDILGGFIIEVNHKVIDASVRHQLQHIAQEMR